MLTAFFDRWSVISASVPFQLTPTYILLIARECVCTLEARHESDGARGMRLLKMHTPGSTQQLHTPAPGSRPTSQLIDLAVLRQFTFATPEKDLLLASCFALRPERQVRATTVDGCSCSCLTSSDTIATRHYIYTSATKSWSLVSTCNHGLSSANNPLLYFLCPFPLEIAAATTVRKHLPSVKAGSSPGPETLLSRNFYPIGQVLTVIPMVFAEYTPPAQ